MTEHPLEKHRPIVRDYNAQMSRTYGYGGGAVILTGGVFLAIAWKTFTLWSPITWCLLFVVLLVGLFVVRSVVNRQKQRIRERIESFCDLNEISALDLRDFFREDSLYPYFIDLFEGRSS